MASESQVNANRKNALKSTGPRTEEGKDASSQNAVKHGLRAKRDVIKTENQDEFALFREKMIADISPDGAMEEMLAERIVSLSWRLKRAEHFQNAVIDALIEHGLHETVSSWHSDSSQRARKEAAETGELDIILGIVINKDFANAKTLEQLLVYERRIESSLYRTIAELKKIRQVKNTENRTLDTEDKLFDASLENENCTNEPNSKETACAEAHPTDICTNEPNLEETAWAEVHPTEDCTNEPNSSACGGKSEYLITKSEIMGDEPMNERTNAN